MADIYFTDFFCIRRDVLARYGALNVSLVADLPLFIDPFLLFNSRKPAYRALHDEIIRYLRFAEARQRAMFLKDVIENKDGYRTFYRGARPIAREEDAQLLFRLTWCGTTADVNREVNNGRGPADFKISRGKFDASLIELKLASNKALERNLQHQVQIYEKASDVKQSLKIILYFSAHELKRVRDILRRLKLDGDDRIILIDARSDNRPSASKAGVIAAARAR